MVNEDHPLDSHLPVDPGHDERSNAKAQHGTCQRPAGVIEPSADDVGHKGPQEGRRGEQAPLRQWQFWRGIATAQRITDLPTSRADLASWMTSFEEHEYAPTDAGRETTVALVDDFAARSAARTYFATTPLRVVSRDRSFVSTFGTSKYGQRTADSVGYQRSRRT